jgi:UDP-N-acetyl-2-amino-2-deoxyglucuronate dehydrogenase
MKVAIIGSGLQAKRRIESIQEIGNDQIVAIFGINVETLDQIGKRYNVKISGSYQTLFDDSEIDLIVICTPPNSHAFYIKKALEKNKRVLVEKPIFQTSKEMLSLRAEFGNLLDSNVICGFNHRFHPGIASMKKKLDEGIIGKILFARSIYGICARNDYQSEWRSNPEFASGGQFIEQGSHVIDLFQWMLGKPVGIYCKTTNLLFDDARLEDGGMAILTFESGATAQMHTTLAQWHNEFRLEIFGEKGFLRVAGLGNAYGVESLEIGMRDEQKPFSSEIIQFRGSDVSWKEEWRALKRNFQNETTSNASFQDGINAMKIAEAAYLSDESSSETKLVL